MNLRDQQKAVIAALQGEVLRAVDQQFPAFDIHALAQALDLATRSFNDMPLPAEERVSA